MPDPRFQLLVGATRTPRVRLVGLGQPGRDGRPEREQQTTWRLLGSNNREMGRSVTTFTSVEQCHDAVLDLQRNVSHLTSKVSTADRRGQWTWSLYLGEDEVAVAARLFARLREARVNLDQFLAKVPGAAIVQLSTSPAALARRMRSYEPPGAGAAKGAL